MARALNLRVAHGSVHRIPQTRGPGTRLIADDSPASSSVPNNRPAPYLFPSALNDGAAFGVVGIAEGPGFAIALGLGIESERAPAAVCRTHLVGGDRGWVENRFGRKLRGRRGTAMTAAWATPAE